jgi:hypothetical protein
MNTLISLCCIFAIDGDFLHFMGKLLADVPPSPASFSGDWCQNDDHSTLPAWIIFQKLKKNTFRTNWWKIHIGSFMIPGPCIVPSSIDHVDLAHRPPDNSCVNYYVDPSRSQRTSRIHLPLSMHTRQCTLSPTLQCYDYLQLGLRVVITVYSVVISFRLVALNPQ